MSGVSLTTEEEEEEEKSPSFSHNKKELRTRRLKFILTDIEL